MAMGDSGNLLDYMDYLQEIRRIQTGPGTLRDPSSPLVWRHRSRKLAIGESPQTAVDSATSKCAL